MEMTSSHAESDRALCLVKGYHQDSYPPEIAYDVGLRRRFAIVLESYRRDKVEMFFDHDLFLGVVMGLSRAIEHDSIEIEMEEGERFSSLGELTKLYDQLAEVDQEPPVRIKFTLEGRLVCVEETEFWIRSGGSEPYHDSLLAAM